MLNVRMLGGFSIGTEEKVISHRDNRSRRLWTLLAYLIYHRHRIVPQGELLDLLWEEDAQGDNPAGALKTTLHRARVLLDGLWPGAGHELILSQNGGYLWSRDISLSVDIDVFEQSCEEKGNTTEQILSEYERLKLYQGDFLENVTYQSWVIPIATYYRNRYMDLLLKVLPQLMEREHYSEIVTLCQIAVNIEPFHEGIHMFMMQALLHMGDQKGAERMYRSFSDRLSSNLGIMPSGEIRKLYYEAVRTDNGELIDPEMVKEQLGEDEKEGALLCEYDFFRVLYRFMARSMERSGMVTHIALFSVTGREGEQLSLRKRNSAMEGLEEVLLSGLRRGDCVARCSDSQYILMLPQANYENSCMVCERIKKAFYRRHPHSDAVIGYVVYLLPAEEDSFGIYKEEIHENGKL